MSGTAPKVACYVRTTSRPVRYARYEVVVIGHVIARLRSLSSRSARRWAARIDAADTGDGAPAIYDRLEDRWVSRREIGA